MNKKLLNTVIIGLLVVNLGTLAMLWMKKGPDGPPPPPPGGPHGGPIEMFLKRDLQFSDEQMAVFRELRIMHHQVVEPLHLEGRKLREKQFQLIGASDGKVQADSLGTLIGGNVKAVEGAVYDHFTAISEICSDDQKETFDELIQEIMKRASPRGPGGPPPGGHPGDRPH